MTKDQEAWILACNTTVKAERQRLKNIIEKELIDSIEYDTTADEFVELLDSFIKNYLEVKE